MVNVCAVLSRKTLLLLHRSSVAACRLKQRKCLQLVRMAPDYIARLHVVALSSELNPQGQSLDIVELAAVYGTHFLIHWINADNYSTAPTTSKLFSLSVCLSICLSVCLPVCLSVCVSVYLSVCL